MQSWYDKSQKIILEDKTDQDIKYQDITYFKCEGKMIVKSKDKIHIDYPQAVTEIKGMGWGDLYYFIGFRNNRTYEILQFAHYEKEKLYVDVPIGGRG